MAIFSLMYNIEHATLGISCSARCHHRLTMGLNTVTESVVLPPLMEGTPCFKSRAQPCRPDDRRPCDGLALP